jgi:hypothetical protein
MKVVAALIMLTIAVVSAEHGVQHFEDNGNENGTYQMEIFQCGFCPYVNHLAEMVRRTSFEMLNGDVKFTTF